MNDSDGQLTSGPIYEGRSTQASEKSVPPWRGRRVTRGIAAALANLLLLTVLGVPHLFGVEGDSVIMIVAVVGAFVGLTRVLTFMELTVAGELLLIAAISFTNIVESPARSLIRRDALPASADAVVSLSAGVTADGFLTRQGLDRMLTAAKLVRDGVAPALVVTTEFRKIDGVWVSSAGDQRRISDLAGIAEVVTTRSVRSTRDEAMAVAEIARRRNWRRVVLVTSPFHSRRACATFEKTGLEVTCAPADSRDISVSNLGLPGERINAFAMWLYETAGTLRYRQRGWL